MPVLAATLLFWAEYFRKEWMPELLLLSPRSQLMILTPLFAIAIILPVVAHWLYTRKAVTCRVFAPVIEGPAWQPLMKMAYAKAYLEARRRGAGVWWG